MDFKTSVRNINKNDSKMPTTKKEDDFFYYTDANRFTIADTSALITSGRTFDMPFFDLANSSKLLNLFNLIDFSYIYGKSNPIQKNARSFCNYISAFKHEDQAIYDKLITNPVVRILILDESLLEKVKLLLGEK